MGQRSQRNRMAAWIILAAALIVSGPLACSSPIPSHFTIRTGPEATPTFTFTPLPPTATATETPDLIPTPADSPSPSYTPTLTPTPQQPRMYTRTPTLTATPTPRLPQGEVYYDDELGLAVVLPEGWTAGKDGNMTSMAISEAVWQSDAPNDPLIILVVGWLEEIFDGALAKAKTPEEVLMVAGGRLGRRWDARVKGVTQTTFKDYQAASGTIEDGNPERRPQLVGQAMSVLLDGRRAAVIWTLAPTDQWEEFQPTLNAVLNAITFTEPTRGPVTPTPTRMARPTPTPRATPAPPTTPQATIKRPPAVPSPTSPPRTAFAKPEDLYVNEWENYSILVPKGWRVYIEEGTFTIAPSVDDFNLEVIRSPMVEVTVGSLSTLWDGAAAGSTDPGPLLEVALKVQAERGIRVVGSPQTLQVAGHPARSVELAGSGLGGRLTSIYLGDNRAALLGVLAPADQWPSFEPIFQAMTESLQFNVM